jgi:hypothetical protein
MISWAAPSLTAPLLSGPLVIRSPLRKIRARTASAESRLGIDRLLGQLQT